MRNAWALSCSAVVVLAVTVVVGAAPAIARANPPSADRVVSLPAASAAAPVAAPTGACVNQAAKSNWHEEGKGEEILPLEQLPDDTFSVPTWSGSFTTAGTVYPYTMVGTDPAAGSATTRVPVEIIPLRLDFPGDCVLEHSGMAADLEASPLFTASADFPAVGETQYLDAIQRASFWSKVSTVSPDYHLLLDTSDVPTVTLQVPGSQGLTIFDPTTGGIDGIVGGQWFLRQLEGLLNSL